MKGPIVRGTIEQRLMSCYACDRERATRLLPSSLRPLEQAGHAVVLVSLDWWRGVRPGFLPKFLAGSPARARHAIAVENHREGEARYGTWSLRVDTSSPTGAWLDGGWLKGTLRRAQIALELDERDLQATMIAHDERIRFELCGQRTNAPARSSLFESVADFARFAGHTGCAGRSQVDSAGDADSTGSGELQWESLIVERTRATLFDQPELFPPGTLTFDSAFLGSRSAHARRAQERRLEARSVRPIQPTLQPAP